MSIILDDRHYATTHEWAKVEEDGLVWVGISDFAQEQLGDVVYIELPEPGRMVKAGEACAVIESVKAASDIYSPVTGEIIAVNTELTDAPQRVNEESYVHWLFKVKADDSAELAKLLTAGEYETATSPT
jgi:glycine cleavage system H protein